MPFFSKFKKQLTRSSLKRQVPGLKGGGGIKQGRDDTRIQKNLDCVLKAHLLSISLKKLNATKISTLLTSSPIEFQ
jgi:hypothetical protein